MTVSGYGICWKRSKRSSNMLTMKHFHPNLQIIGEAASRISSELRAQHPEVAWGGMIGMRHVLVHGYFETDKELVWRVVEQDIPTLKSQIEKILAE